MVNLPAFSCISQSLAPAPVAVTSQTALWSIGLSFLADDLHSISIAQTENIVCNIYINTTANFKGALARFLGVVKIMVSWFHEWEESADTFFGKVKN